MVTFIERLPLRVAGRFLLMTFQECDYLSGKGWSDLLKFYFNVVDNSHNTVQENLSHCIEGAHDKGISP